MSKSIDDAIRALGKANEGKDRKAALRALREAADVELRASRRRRIGESGSEHR
jgi:hypothetical protein